MTASSEQRPTARNTFRITRPAPSLQSVEDDPNDDILKFGQAFFLACNESLLVSADGYSLAPNLYLASTLKNERTSTKVTNKQAVYLTSRGDGNAVWSVMVPSRGKISALERVVSLGTPIQIGEPFILNHRSTNSFLTVNPSLVDLTDFGQELEVHTTRDNGRGKLSILESEFKGITTGNLTKHDVQSNELVFVTADDPMASEDNRKLPNPPTYDDLLDDLSHAIRALGFTAIIELRKSLLDVDRGVPGGAVSGRIKREDLIRALNNRGVITQDGYYDPIFQSLDENDTGYIDYRDFLGLIRGPLPDARLNFLVSLYRKLDKDATDNILLQDLVQWFHPSEFPCVKAGLISEREMREEYFGNVVTATKRRKALVVTPDSFVDYFADISATTKDSSIFDTQLLRAFGV